MRVLRRSVVEGSCNEGSDYSKKIELSCEEIFKNLNISRYSKIR
jgi:hypothetical protein